MRFISNNKGLHIQMDKDELYEGGTPVLVYKRIDNLELEANATFECAIQEGELMGDDGMPYKLNPSEMEWLDNNTPLVVAWLDQNSDRSK